jgi:hypothetical protein
MLIKHFYENDSCNNIIKFVTARACGLVVRVSGYRYRGSGFDSGATRFSE